jgi:hypothetical protein
MLSSSKIRRIRRPCFNIDGCATLWTVALKRRFLNEKRNLGLDYCSMGSSFPRSRDTVPLMPGEWFVQKGDFDSRLWFFSFLSCSQISGSYIAFLLLLWQYLWGWSIFSVTKFRFWEIEVLQWQFADKKSRVILVQNVENMSFLKIRCRKEKD